MTKIDLEQLRLEIRKLHRSQPLYRLLRDELTAWGFWRKRARGDPALGYKMRGKNK